VRIEYNKEDKVLTEQLQHCI